MCTGSNEMSEQNPVRQCTKVFIGGLSWETTGEKLRSYFENYGVVREAFVSYNRNNGRPRGFGFVVFESLEVADKVVATKHTIDRREVEAKRAVPKDEQAYQEGQQGSQTEQQGQGSVNASSSESGSKNRRKIFVGGLAPSVDDKALREYFEAFGEVDDAVVMYDHDNKRPRGFGFVTFVSEDSLELVFAKGTMQSIRDKQIEIKSAVPRDQMPASARPQNSAFDPHFRSNVYPYANQQGMPGHYVNMPGRGGYGTQRHNFAPTAAHLQGSSNRGGPQMRFNGAHGMQMPGGYPHQQQGAAMGRHPGSMQQQGKVPPMPTGYEALYPAAVNLGNGNPAGMFGANTQAALAYSLATLQQQAQAHLHNMSAPAGVTAATAAPKLNASGFGGAANLNNLKALALAGGFGAGFPSGQGAEAGAAGSGGFPDETGGSFQQQQGGQQQHGDVSDYEAAAAVAANLGAINLSGGDYSYHDSSFQPTPAPGWSS